MAESSANYSSKSCSIHPREIIRAFCRNCREAVCITCFILKHSGHEHCELEEIEEEIKSNITQNISKIEMKRISAEEELKKIGPQIQEFNYKMLRLEENIDTQKEMLIKQIQEQAISVSSEAKKFKNEILEMISSRKHAIEEYKTNLDQLILDSSQVMKTSVCEGLISLSDDFFYRSCTYTSVMINDLLLPEVEFRPGNVNKNLNNMGTISCYDLASPQQATRRSGWSATVGPSQILKQFNNQSLPTGYWFSQDYTKEYRQRIDSRKASSITQKNVAPVVPFQQANGKTAIFGKYYGTVNTDESAEVQYDTMRKLRTKLPFDNGY